MTRSRDVSCPRESSVVASFLRRVKALGPGWRAYKNHGGPFAVAGRPDVEVFHDGRAVLLEFKQPGKRPTPRQAVEHDALRRAGMRIEVVTTAEEAMKIVREELT